MKIERTCGKVIIPKVCPGNSNLVSAIVEIGYFSPFKHKILEKVLYPADRHFTADLVESPISQNGKGSLKVL